ncbi:MAG: hypothetical protein HKP57_01500 [Halobacteria archaeon]|nr:hypothetical protein [Halobacteria archaeon]
MDPTTTDTAFHCYSQRMLNPFRGIVSYVSYRSADAVTADGSQWDIYVSNAALLDGLETVRRPQISDIRYGSWSARQGLKRGPLLPSDDFLQMEAMGTLVYQHLLEIGEQVPFPLQDRYELWLLDADARPLALIDSALAASDIDTRQSLVWRPGQDCRRTFTSSVAEQLISEPERPGAMTDYLATYINSRTGDSAAAQLFERNADGSGSGLQVINLPDSLSHRSLPASEFPVHLLDMQRHDALHAHLVHDFICWQAPWQLSLPGMDAAERGEFEQHARVQPLKLAHLYRLYPEIIDRAVIDAARVEARLRSTHRISKPAEKVMSTFYIELCPEAADR